MNSDFKGYDFYNSVPNRSSPQMHSTTPETKHKMIAVVGSLGLT